MSELEMRKGGESMFPQPISDLLDGLRLTDSEKEQLAQRLQSVASALHLSGKEQNQLALRIPSNVNGDSGAT